MKKRSSTLLPMISSIAKNQVGAKMTNKWCIASRNTWRIRNFFEWLARQFDGLGLWMARNGR